METMLGNALLRRARGRAALRGWAGAERARGGRDPPTGTIRFFVFLLFMLIFCTTPTKGQPGVVVEAAKPNLRSRPRLSLLDFPERLAAWLHYRGETIGSICARTGVSRGLVAKWLSSDSSPSMRSAHKVAHAMGISAAELFAETPWERVTRCLMSHSVDASRDGLACLAGIQGLASGDFLAAVNRVPLDAVPVIRPGDGIVEWLEPDGVASLLKLPLFEHDEVALFHNPGGRRAVVLASLRALEVELRRWRYHLRDRMLASQAIEAIGALSDGSAL